MNHQLDRTLLEITTSMAPADVLAAAKYFFSRRASIYSSYVEKESETHVALRGQGGEELIIGVRPGDGGGAAVTGSTYLFDQQIGRFFASLPPAEQHAPPALPLVSPTESTPDAGGGAA